MKKANKKICDKCGCSWFREIIANQYPLQSYNQHGKEILVEGAEVRYLECAKCKTTILPEYVPSISNRYTESWNNFCDEIEKK